MTITSAPAPLMTLADVAALAQVQRPVVSMWRRRKAGSAQPFPAPAVLEEGREYFDQASVVEWLHATALGNNPAVAEDAAMFVALDALGSAERPTALAGLTSLLAVKALTGEELSARSAAELLELADDVDPADAFVFREIDGLGESAPDWAARADAMAAAAYTPSAALAALDAMRVRLGMHAAGSTVLDARAADLVARIVAAVLGVEGTAAIVAATGATPTLARARARFLEGAEPEVLLPLARSAAGRHAHRLLAGAGWSTRVVGGDLLEQVPTGSVLYAQFPSPELVDASDAQVLDVAEELALSMRDEDRAVVVAPASGLVQATTPALAQARAAVLRTGRVRAILLLPAGCWPAHPRQRLAIWVLGSAHPGVPVERRWLTVAEPDGSALDEPRVEDVVTDVLAALGDERAVRAHAFRCARVVGTSDLVASRGDLIGPPDVTRTRAQIDPVAAALRVEEAAARVSAPVVPFGVEVEHHEPGPRPTTTLGALVRDKAVRLVAGSRIAAEDIEDGGSGAVVLGVAELMGDSPRGARTVDRLTLAGSYPSSRYTQPGDVVFCTSPTPRAFVDTDGVCVVVSPARVLRLTESAPAGLLPEVLAQAINAARPGEPWRSWRVPLIPDAQAPLLQDVLERSAQVRADLQARLGALNDVTTTLTDAVACGALTLTSARADVSTEKEG